MCLQWFFCVNPWLLNTVNSVHEIKVYIVRQNFSRPNIVKIVLRKMALFDTIIL